MEADELSLTPERVEYIRRVQGGKVEGLVGIGAVNERGEPAVVRVASLVKGKPFPTLFWLIDPDIVRSISHEEAAGRIVEFQRRVDSDAALRERMAEDHRRHRELRDSFISPEMRGEIERLGFASVLSSRGIGGIERPDTIRCLHTWYASHMVVPNTIGTMLDEYWAERRTPHPLRMVKLMKLSYSQACRNPEAAFPDAQYRRDFLTIKDSGAVGQSDVAEFYASARNFPEQFGEARELRNVCLQILADHPSGAIIDVGCSHGLTSHIMARLEGPNRPVVWVDRNQLCRAAQFSERLGVPFFQSLESAAPPPGSLVLIVNLCGPPLLEAIALCKNVSFCVVPCCGPEGVAYSDWVNRVREAVPKPNWTRDLTHNLGRTAIVYSVHLSN